MDQQFPQATPIAVNDAAVRVLHREGGVHDGVRQAKGGSEQSAAGARQLGGDYLARRALVGVVTRAAETRSEDEPVAADKGAGRAISDLHRLTGARRPRSQRKLALDIARRQRCRGPGEPKSCACCKNQNGCCGDSPAG